MQASYLGPSLFPSSLHSFAMIIHILSWLTAPGSHPCWLCSSVWSLWPGFLRPESCCQQSLAWRTQVCAFLSHTIVLRCPILFWSVATQDIFTHCSWMCEMLFKLFIPCFSGQKYIPEKCWHCGSSIREWASIQQDLWHRAEFGIRNPNMRLVDSKARCCNKAMPIFERLDGEGASASYC